MNIILNNTERDVVGVLVLSFLIFTSACTASKHSSQKINEAEIVMEQTEKVEAMNYAQEEFQEAQMKLEDARQLAEKGKHKKAVLKAEETKVAAELAEIKTLSQKADETIKELNVSIESLKERLEQYRQSNGDSDER